MAAIQAATPLPPSPLSLSSSSTIRFSYFKPQLHIKSKLPSSTHVHSRNFPFCPPHPQPAASKNPFFKQHSTVQEVAVETKPDEAEKETSPSSKVKRKLYVVNLPWSFSVSDVKNLFGQCGTVTDVEVLKQKDGKSRRFVFVTMATGEEAQAAIDKLDSYEVSGRIIRVEFAKKYKKPFPPSPPTGETRHKLYVTNLAWRVRGTHLREFFSANFEPVSSRVVFDGPNGRSTGYGFVSFATREEAEAALSAMNGKELMGRPLQLKFSVKADDESESKEQVSQPEE